MRSPSAPQSDRRDRKPALQDLQKNGITARVYGRPQAAVFDLDKMGAKFGRLRTAVRHLRLRVVNAVVRSLLTGARRRAHHLAGVPGRFKDYISTPKQNDLPFAFTPPWIGPGNQRVELQIRTEENEPDRRIPASLPTRSTRKAWAADRAAQARNQRPLPWLRHTVGILSESANPEEFLEHTKLELFHDQVFSAFTPKGKLIALPRQANVIDFAYAVHTESATRPSAARSTASSRPFSSRTAERRRG